MVPTAVEYIGIPLAGFAPLRIRSNAINHHYGKAGEYVQ